MLTELIGRGIKRLTTGRSDTENPQQWFIDFANGGVGSATSSGEHITPENALRVPPVKAAVSVLAESIQVLPIEIMRLEKSGTKTRAADHPVQELFFREVNDEMSTAVWKNTSQIHLGTYGNTYSHIGRTKGNIPITLDLLSPRPSRTKQIRGVDGKIHYELRDKQGQIVGRPTAKDIFHVPYFSFNGIMGQSPITLLKEAVGGNKAAERYANELFKNGGTPQGFFTHPGELSEPAYARLKKSLAEHAEHGNRHSTQILEEAMEFKAAAMEPEKVQMIEARVFLITEICRIYRITPHLLQELTHGTFTNVAELGRQFITFTMAPWMNLWAGEINRKLLKPPFFARFNPLEFLRGDPKELAEWFKSMFMIGNMSVNQIRADQGQDPLSDPNADEHFVPMNMIPLSKATDPDWVKRGGGQDNDPKPGGVPGGDGVTPGDATMSSSADVKEAISLAMLAMKNTLERMQRLEVNSAIRASKHPKTFSQNLSKFWLLQQDRLIESLTLPMGTLHVLKLCRRSPGADLNDVQDRPSTQSIVYQFVKQRCDQRHGDLIVASECKPSELADRVAAVVESWTPDK